MERYLYFGVFVDGGIRLGRVKKIVGYQNL
jgi:hypothetical protein